MSAPDQWWAIELECRRALLMADAERILRETAPGGAMRGAMLGMQRAQEAEDDAA